MTNPIRVLHVLGGVGLGGAESRIMDLYRQMDRDEIRFDFGSFLCRKRRYFCGVGRRKRRCE